MFGDVEHYNRTLTFYFSKEALDGGNGDEAKPLSTTFMGNSTAEVSGMIMVELPTDDSSRIALHRKYGSMEAIKMNLLRNAIAGALKQTGPMFRPEEAFTTRRPEFTQLMRDIIINGIYDTKTIRDSIVDQDKVITLERSVIDYDTNGKPKLLTESTLKKYNIVVSDFVIKDLDFDDATDALIQEKKVSQQKIVAARAMAEKAKQDAITATETGKANVAKAEADALVQKKTAVVNAEKEAAVAAQNKLKAEMDAGAQLALAKAEAEANRLKVSAGLTPQERAEYDMKTKIGVAKALSEWKGPEIVMGGGSNGNSMMADAIAIKQMMGIAEQMSRK
jgi:hypothetical protein